MSIFSFVKEAGEKLIDLLTPGKLGDIVTDPQPQPATWVTAVAHLGVGLIIAAALS